MVTKQGKVNKIYPNVTKTGKKYWSFYVVGDENSISTFEDMTALEGVDITFDVTEKPGNDGRTFYNAKGITMTDPNAIPETTATAPASGQMSGPLQTPAVQEFNGMRFGMCCNLAMQKQAMENKPFDFTIFGKDVEDFHKAVKMIEETIRR